MDFCCRVTLLRSICFTALLKFELFALGRVRHLERVQVGGVRSRRQRGRKRVGIGPRENRGLVNYNLPLACWKKLVSLLVGAGMGEEGL